MEPDNLPAFNDGLLTIQGERHLPHAASERGLHRIERRYGAFRRSVTLPTHVVADAIQATTVDGVLQVMVPKRPGTRPGRSKVVSPGQVAVRRPSPSKVASIPGRLDALEPAALDSGSTIDTVGLLPWCRPRSVPRPTPGQRPGKAGPAYRGPAKRRQP